MTLSTRLRRQKKNKKKKSMQNVIKERSYHTEFGLRFFYITRTEKETECKKKTLRI